MSFGINCLLWICRSPQFSPILIGFHWANFSGLLHLSPFRWLLNPISKRNYHLSFIFQIRKNKKKMEEVLIIWNKGRGERILLLFLIWVVFLADFQQQCRCNTPGKASMGHWACAIKQAQFYLSGTENKGEDFWLADTGRETVLWLYYHCRGCELHPVENFIYPPALFVL